MSTVRDAELRHWDCRSRVLQPPPSAKVMTLHLFNSLAGSMSLVLFLPDGPREKQSRGQLKCDGTRAETRFRLSAKRTSPFKSAGASVQSTTGSWGVRISGSNAG